MPDPREGDEIIPGESRSLDFAPEVQAIVDNFRAVCERNTVDGKLNREAINTPEFSDALQSLRSISYDQVLMDPVKDGEVELYKKVELASSAAPGKAAESIVGTFNNPYEQHPVFVYADVSGVSNEDDGMSVYSYEIAKDDGPMGGGTGWNAKRMNEKTIPAAQLESIGWKKE